MKKILNYLFAFGALATTVSCQKNFVDLDPPAQYTDAVYFKKAGDFKAYATGFYGQLQGWSFGNMDNSSDISANSNGNGSDLGHGTIIPSNNNWNYSGIRSCNILLSKVGEYDGAESIDQYVGEAYFFRAYSYFNLLKTFGGVPIITDVLDIDAPELFGKRNSRYEVIELILSDLDQAINRLPTEQNIPASEKGRVSNWAAKAFKAQVSLYAATWQKYVGQATDGDGVSVGAGTAGYDPSNINRYLADAIVQVKDVMDNGGYELWNKNADPSMANLSSWYLFNLEDGESNPGGYDKSTNNEFILYSVYDFTHRQSRLNISWTSWQLYPSRKFVDMAVCTDGLPADKSPLFQGYHTFTSEFQNRDRRLLNYLYAATQAPATITLSFGGLGFGGYGNSKFAVFGHGSRRPDLTESANWPIIRLAEVYLIYAEALYELNETITDEQLDESVNLLRARGAVAPLTNALATAHGLDMREEIRRERAMELYREGKRFDDLKRWGILEESLNASRLGRVVGDGSYATPFKNPDGSPTEAYQPNTYVWGEETVQTADGILNCVIISSNLNHSVMQRHYLYPISIQQIQLNGNLLQNPGY
ncbi:RagB/SusD family nutrient uptake outer membrane protein [Parapedobacter tibetensis]|uniref:RagB/SusD family nutrient uptake outer membrane protein n=1 Tax=Parapedobacter tibetensis TaxID=2972951 RepID=UPI00214DCD1B|nr:RagB/SusD family nutrient uptake outer membrane protein [Parapedobacter tibetensis]